MKINNTNSETTARWYLYQYRIMRRMGCKDAGKAREKWERQENCQKYCFFCTM
jgi:hypothetical protein